VTVVSPRGEERERSGFEDFYRERYQRAVRLAWLLTGDADRCEDVVQDAFTRLHGRWVTIVDPPAYLRTSIVNGCRDAARRREREQRRLRLVQAHDAVDPTDLVLLDAVARLPYKQRAAVILRYWADLADEDIARTLDVAPATVRSLLFRALRSLRDEIDR
jgi:RNA polymerase sigma-70 factor (sigma-E family)